ncbi:hypothetical protein [Paenibacillus cremeus]|nr:hypothetical protein [Paenibacillus cremeus]
MNQELPDIYKAYRRDTWIGRRPALLVIDLCNLVHQGGASRPFWA